jgi:ATP-binding cassette subfamily F protein 3
VLAGEQAPDAGRATLGAAVTAAWYHQDLGQVPMDRSLFDIIHDRRPRWNRGQVQGHLGRFGFPGEAVLRKPATLSGGERARMALALLMLTEANLLLLDEPTNHLDVESIEVLEDALMDFPGTVLLVSHDRALLRAVTNRTWAYRDDRIVDYPGGFEEWEIVEEEREAAETAQWQRLEQERRVVDRQRAAQRSSGSRNAQAELRSARRSVERAEETVHALEREVARLTEALADPDLYTAEGGAERAAKLAARLAVQRGELDAALEAWSEAGSSLEALLSGEAG